MVYADVETLDNNIWYDGTKILYIKILKDLRV